MFQFQFGTIGSELIEVPETFGFMFQFQFGTIGRLTSLPKGRIGLVSIPVWYDWEFVWIKGLEPLTGFNSSLVRLGEFLKDNDQDSPSSFNSSLVRLGVSAVVHKGKNLVSFNSSLVRLGALN